MELPYYVFVRLPHRTDPDLRVRGEAWWTLGLEATGPADALRGELDAAAAVVFAQVLPDGVELGMDDPKSYAQWLRRRLTPSGRG